ncbi:MAG TPA: hypothetical protein VEW08_10705 [Steroidobacteraceae bacterium]|nr:hypothetical protein [Steroidobacteraceae bacterium]
MRNLFRARPKSFLDAPRREWQFAVFAWMLRNCGGYPKFLDTTLVLPIEEHFPDRDLTGHAAVAALFRRVRDHAGMADWPCTVEPEPADGRALPATSDRNPVITYKRGEFAAMSMAGAFAHELARMLVETFDEPPPGGAQLHEPAIDLAAVFMGFGVFMANSTFEATRYDLNEGEFVHALALFCLLRKLEPESIARHLNPHLRKYLRLASRDLAQHEPDFHKLRTVFAVVPFEVAERTLPTRVR